MTVETKQLITPSEISAVRVECAACRAAYTVPIGMPPNPPSRCRSCSAEWFPDAAEVERQALERLVESIRTLSGMTHKVPWRLKLELLGTGAVNAAA